MSLQVVLRDYEGVCGHELAATVDRSDVTALVSTREELIRAKGSEKDSQRTYLVVILGQTLGPARIWGYLNDLKKIKNRCQKTFTVCRPIFERRVVNGVDILCLIGPCRLPEKRELHLACL